MEYQRINLDDYVQTGQGGTSLTYDNKNGRTLVKLFVPTYGKASAGREFLVNQAVYASGISTPEPLRLVTDGTRYGAEYELIPNKRSFTRIISEEPEQLEPLSLRFAHMARQVHQTPADTALFPDMRELVRFHIGRYKALSQELKDRLLAKLDTLPAPATCLHGDLHIGNIITDGTRDLWIDVGDFSYGCPEWDLGMTYFALQTMSEARAQEIFHLDLETLRKHWNLFARAYWNTDAAEEIAAYERALAPFIALKLSFLISKLHDGKGEAPEPFLRALHAYLR